MSSAKGIRQVAYVDTRSGGGVGHTHEARSRFAPIAWHDCAGGGQVVVERNIAYVGNMRNPHGTLIIDEVKPGRTTGVVGMRTTVHNQNRKLVLEGTQRYLLRKRPAPTVA